MFNNSKYSQIYTQITTRAKGKPKAKGDEFHHVIPDCLGGTRNKDNMVYLTTREHFICHWLLSKMTDGENKAKMIYALNGMKRANKLQDRYTTKITSRVYARLKAIAAKQHSELMKGRVPPNKGIPRTEEQKQAQREKMLGRKLTPDQLARSIASRTGQKRTFEQRKNISNSTKGILRGPMSDENKAKISVGSKGIKKSAECSAKKAETLKALSASGQHHSQIVKVCPHCGVSAKTMTYARWHGDNCKMYNIGD